jgi:hypothetical protein
LAQRKRNISRRAALSSDARAWLRGEKCGFFEFQNDDALEAVWNEYGDDEAFFWRRDMSLPITLEKLEAVEDAWLNSGEDDEYGFNSFFIAKHYSDEEKQTLWHSRGNKKRFRWSRGMWKPEAIADPERQNEC